MTKKNLAALILAVFVLCGGAGVIIASETTGEINVGMQTGMEGVIKSAPTASPVAGEYHVTKTVSLTASGSTAICYTTDGTTTPICSGTTSCSAGTKYSSALSVTETTTVKSVACYADSTSGTVSTDTYTLTCATTSVSHGSVGAYPTCTITCDSGYTLSGSSCNASGSSGGGGGGGYISPSTPTPTPTPTLIPTPTPIISPVVVPTLPSNPTNADYQNLLNALLQQLAYLQGLLLTQQGGATPTPTPVIVGAGYRFSVGLQFGDTGEGVRQLQIFLKAQGTAIYPEGLITGYFGSATKKAVQRFQEKYGIANVGDAGYGYVGPLTRAKINALQGL